MKPIQKDELYKHLSQFLKSKGVELKEGSYSRGIHAGCSLLADAINLSQAGLQRAKSGLDKGINQVRQTIHEKTAPAGGSTSAKPAQKQAASSARRANRKPAAKKRRKNG